MITVTNEAINEALLQQQICDFYGCEEVTQDDQEFEAEIEEISDSFDWKPVIFAVMIVAIFVLVLFMGNQE
jgi:hypothetical protein